MKSYGKKMIVISIILLILFLIINTLFVTFTTSVNVLDTDEKNTIKAMTYNIHGYISDFKLDPAIEKIIAVNPKILVLQEALSGEYQGVIQSPATVLANKLNMSVFTTNSSTPTTTPGIVILSSYPMEKIDIIPLPSLGNFIKYLLVANITTPQGSIIVMGTHLELPYYPNIQTEQVGKIIDVAKNFKNILFLCDCNSPDIVVHPAYNKLARYFQDAWISDGHSAFGGNTWTTDNPRLRVDYIWYRGDNVRIVRDTVKQVGGNASDHFGLSAEIILK